jgi:hypothetical protein
MKKIVLLSALFIFGLTTVNAQETAAASKNKKEHKASKKAIAPEVKGPGMVFEKETIDYGTIDQNADGHREFVFVNNGDQPLKIENAQGSCGCTVPEAPKEPIAPGAKGVIKVKYDTNRVGTFQKNVTVTSNASQTPKVLIIKGEVKATAAPAPVQTPAAPATVQEVKS